MQNQHANIKDLENKHKIEGGKTRKPRLDGLTVWGSERGCESVKMTKIILGERERVTTTRAIEKRNHTEEEKTTGREETGEKNK